VAILFLLSLSVAPVQAYQSNEQMLKGMGLSGSSTIPLVEINEIALDAVSGSAVVSGTEKIVDGNVRMNIRTDGFDPGNRTSVQAGGTPATRGPLQADPEVQDALNNLSRSGYTYAADGDHRYEVKISADALPALNQSQREVFEDAGFTIQPDGSLVQLVDASIYSITNTSSQETGQLMVTRTPGPAGSPAGEKQYIVRLDSNENVQAGSGLSAASGSTGKTPYDKKIRALQWIKVGVLAAFVLAMIAVYCLSNAAQENTVRMALNIYEQSRLAATTPWHAFNKVDKIGGRGKGWRAILDGAGIKVLAIVTGIGLLMVLLYEISVLGVMEGWWGQDSSDKYVWSYRYRFTDADNGKRVPLDVNSRFALALYADTRADPDARWVVESDTGLVIRDTDTVTMDNGTFQSWLFLVTEPGPRELVLEYRSEKPVPPAIASTRYTLSLDVEGRKWDIRTVETTADNAGTGRYSSLAIDRAGVPHISYYDAAKGRIRYVRLDGTKWSYEKVADSKGTYTTSLALDANGNPSISFSDGLHYGNLMYATRNGTKWDIATVDKGSAGDAGQYSSLVLDAAGTPHIMYNDGQYFATLKYATRNGSTWEISTVDNAGIPGDTGFDPLLVLDKTGIPHVSYRDGTHYANLMYATNVGANWTTTVVDRGNSSTGSTGYYTSLVLDSTGSPCIAYYDAKNTDLRYASWNGTGWNTETVDRAGDVGKYASLAIDSNDNPHIGYYDATNRELRYATRDTGITEWVIRTVDNDSDVGQYAKIALDPSGHPCFSYYDATNHALKYAGWRG
jgi:hypothetical protein